MQPSNCRLLSMARKPQQVGEQVKFEQPTGLPEIVHFNRQLFQPPMFLKEDAKSQTELEHNLTLNVEHG